MERAVLFSDAVIAAKCEWPSLRATLSGYELTRDALSSEMSSAIDLVIVFCSRRSLLMSGSRLIDCTWAE